MVLTKIKYELTNFFVWLLLTFYIVFSLILKCYFILIILYIMYNKLHIYYDTYYILVLICHFCMGVKTSLKPLEPVNVRKKFFQYI